MKGNTPVPRLKNHRIVVNQAWCKKCGICIAFCAKGVLALGDGGMVESVRSDNCVGCGICESLCPDYAITLEEEEE
ncbi:4Fe-4S dicluster domain-containing protein [Desulforamulus aquiferis]|uniref:4Fe-4S binding protein n=1 Tax=Desulforamulus aquiferis TaxID=1397668 RepID=A0AAW7Z9S4_9FIRM|nr:4Fe-4S dicluster domain-containing protein [Desulforamulus aquiferis]MDO7786160.1 4Fe-4S binding protein [Desulforamulus aquiferis]